MRDSSIHADGRLLSALGAVMVDFSMLDAALQLAISLMMMPQTSDIVAGLDAAKKNLIVTAEMSFKQRVYAFASLYRHRWQEEVTPEFEALCKHLHGSEDRRNQLVHSSYVADEESGHTLRRKSTAKTKHGFRCKSRPLMPGKSKLSRNRFAEWRMKFSTWSWFASLPRMSLTRCDEMGTPTRQRSDRYNTLQWTAQRIADKLRAPQATVSFIGLLGGTHGC